MIFSSALSVGGLLKVSNLRFSYPFQTFSLTINGVSQHLISYYKVEDVEQGRLRCPTSYPELASLEISPEYLDKTHFRNPPKTEQGPDGLPRYRGEADDVEPSPHSVLDHALSLPVPILSAPTEVGGSSRRKRFEPYSASGSKASRSGRNKKTQGSGSPPPADNLSPASGFAPSGYSGDPNNPLLQYGHPYTYGLTAGMGMGAHPNFAPLPYSLPTHSIYPPPYPPSTLPPQTGSPSPVSPVAGSISSPTAGQGASLVSPTSATSLPSPYNPFSTGGPTGAGSDAAQQQQQQYYSYFSPPHPGYASPYWAHPYGYPSPQLTQQIATGSAADATHPSLAIAAAAEQSSGNGTGVPVGNEHSLHGQLGGGSGDNALVGVTVGT